MFASMRHGVHVRWQYSLLWVLATLSGAKGSGRPRRRRALQPITTTPSGVRENRGLSSDAANGSWRVATAIEVGAETRSATLPLWVSGPVEGGRSSARFRGERTSRLRLAPGDSTQRRSQPLVMVDSSPAPRSALGMGRSAPLSGPASPPRARRSGEQAPVAGQSPPRTTGVSGHRARRCAACWLRRPARGVVQPPAPTGP